MAHMPSSDIRWFSVKRVRLLMWFSVRWSQSRKSLLVKGFDGRKRCPHHMVVVLTHVFYHLKRCPASTVMLSSLYHCLLQPSNHQRVARFTRKNFTPSACGPDVVIYRSPPDLLLASSAPCPLSTPWVVERDSCQTC